MFYPEGLSFPETSEYSFKTDSEGTTLNLPKGKIVYIPQFLSGATSRKYISSFLLASDIKFKNLHSCQFSTEELENALWENIPWQRDKIKIFGKEHFTPRLTSWHGDNNALYSYSNTPLIPKPWTKELVELKNKIEQFTSNKFNSVLLNWYRNGEDHMGWHSDDEKELGENPVIASLNLGASRKFVLRRKANHQEKIEIVLNNGDLLIMSDETQHFWQHYVPKQKKVKTNRFNLTFREIKSIR